MSAPTNEAATNDHSTGDCTQCGAKPAAVPQPYSAVQMHIRLELENWRSIEDALVDIRPFTVVVGRNSSGKSNIVDALLFANEVGRDAVNAVARRGGITSIRRWSYSKPTQVRIDMRVADSADDMEADYFRHKMVLHSGDAGAWSFRREEIEVVRKGRRELFVNRQEQRATVEGLRRLSAKEIKLPDTASVMVYARQLLLPMLGAGQPRPMAAARSLRPVPELMRAPQPPSESPRLVETAINITSAVRALGERSRGDVVLAMSRIIPGLNDIRAELVGRYLTLVFSQDQGPRRQAEFAATEMSDGALRALAIVVAAHQMKPHELLIIEEPEVNLHPGAAHVVYDVLRHSSRHGAVLITTHSPELLDQASGDDILVCEYVDGVTRIGPLADAQRGLVRDGLFTVAELMRSDDLRSEGSEPEIVKGAG